MKIKVRFKKLREGAKQPLYATENSAGCDFYSIEEITLLPNETRKIATGIAVEIPQGYFLKIEDRSGLGAKGIHHLAGIIDSDYRGEIFIVLHNLNKEPYKIEKGDRIAQGIFLQFYQGEFEESKNLTETKRGEGGFNSTGKK